jgi:hypothetical protein
MMKNIFCKIKYILLLISFLWRSASIEEAFMSTDEEQKKTYLGMMKNIFCKILGTFWKHKLGQHKHKLVCW